MNHTDLRKFFSKMVYKVKWLHDCGYVHRDLKVGAKVNILT